MTFARVRGAYEKFLEAVVILLMAALAIEVTVGVIFRTSGYSLVWYDEIASILLAWLTFYGSALAAVKRAHIGCPEVIAMLSPRAKLVFRIIAEALVIAFFALIAWVGYSILDVLATDSLVSLPEVPVNYIQSVLPISAVLIIFAEILTLPAVLAETRTAPGIHGPSTETGPQ
ncbi:MAG: TRAP transporter small permease [Betaproteobacteria bacterium]|nr:TRAP transporter small permease [Betaproteobacteria bacterium]